jgi:hypothetical protein
MAVLGGTPGQSEGAQQGGGAINMPAFRYAGADGGGGGGGGGGLDLSGIDWNDPQQAEMARRWLEREGGQGGEPGGAGAGGIEPGEPGYTNLNSPFGTLLDVVQGIGPFPLDLVARLAELGIRTDNMGRLDSQLEDAGFESGLSGLQQLGAATGFNDYGEGSWGGNLAGSAAAQRSAVSGGQGFNSVSGAGGSYRTSPAGPTQRSGGSSYSGGGHDAGRDAGQFSGGGRAGGVGLPGPGGGFGERSNVRGGFGGGGMSRQQDIFHDGGMVDGLPGEEVDGTLLAGEYVMSPEAVDMVGPDNLGRMNSLARMMGQQHYPAR